MIETIAWFLPIFNVVCLSVVHHTKFAFYVCLVSALFFWVLVKADFPNPNDGFTYWQSASMWTFTTILFWIAMKTKAE